MRRVGYLVLVACVLVVAAALGGCSKGSSSSRELPSPRIAAETTVGTGTRPLRSDRVLQVVATTSVVADWLRVIGSTNVRTQVIVKAGLDPVSYLATPLDVAALKRTDLIVAVGHGLEPWLEPTRRESGTVSPVVVLGEGLPRRATPSGAGDPFLWLDLDNAKQMVNALTAALVTADPVDAAAFNAARDAYLADLTRLDDEVRRVLGPVAGRGLVTAKETFGWFAARYGLEVVGAVVPSLDGLADIPPQHLASLRQAIEAKQVKAVFAERSVPDASVRSFAQEVGVKPVVGSDALIGDNLGQAGTPTDTFVGILRHNARSLAANL